MYASHPELVEAWETGSAQTEWLYLGCRLLPGEAVMHCRDVSSMTLELQKP